MKLRFSLCCLLFLFVLTMPFGVSAQSYASAVLIDEFEVFPCSEFRFSMDNFMTELLKEPGSEGYILNSGPRQNLASIVWREELQKTQIEMRRFPISRITFDRSIASEKVVTQLWKIPQHGIRPVVSGQIKSLALDKTKPFFLIEDSFYNDSECPDVNHTKVFARFLKANPQARGNLVIFGTSTRELASREREVRSTLKAEGISPTRVKYFRRIYRYSPQFPKGVEYWYLP
jgi:hypothetical protein